MSLVSNKKMGLCLYICHCHRIPIWNNFYHLENKTYCYTLAWIIDTWHFHSLFSASVLVAIAFGLALSFVVCSCLEEVYIVKWQLLESSIYLTLQSCNAYLHSKQYLKFTTLFSNFLVHFHQNINIFKNRLWWPSNLRRYLKFK